MVTGERYGYQHFLMSEPISSSSDHVVFDFDEADIWNAAAVGVSSSPADHHDLYQPALPGLRGMKKKKKSSLPIKIGDYYLAREVEEEEGEEVWFPPHVFLARQRRHDGTVSFSVHEGIGRTLKGRDLSTVRNAIWERTGFQD